MKNAIRTVRKWWQQYQAAFIAVCGTVGFGLLVIVVFCSFALLQGCTTVGLRQEAALDKRIIACASFTPAQRREALNDLDLNNEPRPATPKGEEASGRKPLPRKTHKYWLLQLEREGC